MPGKYKPRTTRPLADRFWSKVEKADSCWLWRARTMPNGYGVVGIRRGVTNLAHRVAWELAHGPIPAGMKVCHRCDVRNCVNPDHLFLGTQADNITDMIAKGRNARGEKMTGAKLTEVQVREIRQRHAIGSVTQTQLATEYGVASTTIGKILRRQRWAHIA